LLVRGKIIDFRFFAGKQDWNSFDNGKFAAGGVD